MFIDKYKDYAKLSAVIKASKTSPLREEKKEFFEELSRWSLTGERFISIPELNHDYINATTKKRAITISSAVTLATSILIAVDSNELQAFYDNTLYARDKSFVEVHLKDNPRNEPYATIVKQYKRLENLIQDNTASISIKEISDIAVTINWAETWYQTGFLPQDLGVLLTTSGEHAELVIEVDTLVRDTLTAIDECLVDKRETLRFESEINNHTYGIKTILSLAIGSTAVIIKTGGAVTLKDVDKDIENALSQIVLINATSEEDNIIKDSLIIYPRYGIYLQNSIATTRTDLLTY